MIIEAIGDAIYGKHSSELNAFEAALKHGETASCLDMLANNPKLALRVERDVFGHDTPLNMAMRYGNPEVCDRLLGLGAKMNVAHQYAGDKQTPMTMIFDPSFKQTVPNYDEIKEVLVKHYVDRRDASKSENLLDDLRAKAAGLFKSFSERIDGLIKEPAIGMAGVGAVGASIGSALGLTAAGALTAAASVPLAIGGAGVGLGVALTHLVRKNLGIDESLSMQEMATERFEELANERRQNIGRNHDDSRGNGGGSNDRDAGSKGNQLGDLRGRASALFKSVSDHVDEISQSDRIKVGSFKPFCVAASQVQASDYAKSIGADVKPIDTEKGRYAGKVMQVVQAHFVQDLGMKTVAIHVKGNFDLNDVGNALNTGKNLRVQYNNGRGSIASTQERSKDQGRSL